MADGVIDECAFLDFVLDLVPNGELVTHISKV